MWTHFWDMHSGGSRKEQWSHIYIEAPKEEAIKIFYNLFDHNPRRVTCTCCGEDYAISEEKTLEEASAFERGCAWDNENECYLEEAAKDRSWQKYCSLDKYVKRKEVRVIYAQEITEELKSGDVPAQGYVWVD